MVKLNIYKIVRYLFLLLTCLTCFSFLRLGCPEDPSSPENVNNNGGDSIKGVYVYFVDGLGGINGPFGIPNSKRAYDCILIGDNTALVCGRDTSYTVIWKTTDGGLNWRIVNQQNDFITHGTLECSNNGLPVFYMNETLTGDNIRSSTDMGETWQNIPGLPPSDHYHIDQSRNSNLVIAVLDENNFYKSIDGGQTFVSIPGPGLYPNNIEIFGVPDTIIISSINSIYARSTDQGNTWIIDTLTEASNSFLEYIAFSEDGFGTVGVMTRPDYGYYRTTNGGVNWFYRSGNIRDVIATSAQTFWSRHLFAPKEIYRGLDGENFDRIWQDTLVTEINGLGGITGGHGFVFVGTIE